MVEVALDRILENFFARAEAYIEAPELTEAIALDDLAASASSACTTRFGTQSGATAGFLSFKQALRAGDIDGQRQALERIRATLAGLGFPVGSDRR